MTIADRVKDTTTSTGIGPVTTSGTPPDHYQGISVLGGAGTTFPYAIAHITLAEWETGIATITGTNTFSRQPTASSNGGALVNFSAGTKDVFCTATADSLKRGLVDPDDVGMDIIMVAGQSKECGRGQSDTLIDLPHPRIFQFGGLSSQASRYQTIFSGQEPLHWPEGLNNGGGTLLTSPANAFARAYVNMIPSNRLVLLVPCAWGSTTLVAGTARWGVGGDLRENMISQGNLALAAAQAIYPNSRIVIIDWDQAEGDVANGVGKAAYKAAAKAFIADCRTRLNGAANALFLINGMIPEYISDYGADGTNIDAAQKEVAAETAKCVFVPAPGGYTTDRTHLTAAGSRIHGVRRALAIRTAQFATGVQLPASALALTLGAASGYVGTAVVVNVGTNNPLTGAQTESVTLTAPVAGTWNPSNTVTLNASTPTAAPTFTPSAAGSGNFTATATGTPALTGASAAFTSNALSAPAAMAAPVATAGVSSASLAFTLPANGGSTITGLTITPYIAGVAQAPINTATLTSPYNVTGLTAGTAYTFRMHATNAIGPGADSADSNSVTPSAAASAPSQMVAPVATAGVGSASVALTSPAANGSAITGYTVVSNPAGGVDANAGTTALTHNMTGLAAGTAYTFTATATNGVGTSPPSPASNPVTPTAPPLSLTAIYSNTIAATGTAGVYQGQANSGFWGSEGCGTLSLAFPNGGDGEFVAQMLDVPKQVNDSTGRAIGIGVDTLTAFADGNHQYIGCDYFLMHRSDACAVYTNGNNAGTDAGGGSIVGAPNDYLRVKRTGSGGAANTATLTFSVSHNGIDWIVIKTFNTAPTTALYVRVGAIWTSSIKLVSASGLA
jgi:hypothetical protein